MANTANTDNNKNDPRDSFIYTVTEQQRNALMSNKDPKSTFESTFGESMLKEIRETYDREGLVLIRGLMVDDTLQRLCDGGQAVADAVKLGSTFTSLKFGPIFMSSSSSDGAVVDDSNKKQQPAAVSGEAFREAAISSTIPIFIAKVLFRMMDPTEEGTTLRILKDAFLAKGKEQQHCGWHVDDSGFWPSDSTSNGVNVWVALDDMPAKFGGGLAVSPKSHGPQCDWKQDAYATIGSTKNLPPEGIVSVDSPLFKKNFGKTCGMETLDPTLNDKIESTKIEFDYQRGDCLFCTRWLFHRSVQINEAGLQHYDDDSTLKRYTIRYERGTAKLIRGISVEPCVLQDSTNSGKSLDEVCGGGGGGAKGQQQIPYYPQCWPPLADPIQQETQMDALAKDVFPQADIKKNQILKEMMTKMKEGAATTEKEESKGY